MSESNSNVIPAINAVDGFNPADFVRTTVGEEGENDLYLDVKYRLLWFRLHHPNGKIDPELIRVDEKNAIVCCRIYADKADPADQFIGKAYSQRFSTEDRFGDRFLEIAETVAKGRALADAGYGTQFCMNGDALAGIIADAQSRCHLMKMQDTLVVSWRVLPLNRQRILQSSLRRRQRLNLPSLLSSRFSLLCSSLMLLLRSPPKRWMSTCVS